MKSPMANRTVRDRRHHVTQKGQSGDPNAIAASQFDNMQQWDRFCLPWNVVIFVFIENGSRLDENYRASVIYWFASAQL